MSATHEAHESQLSRGWLTLAVGALVVAGAFAVLLVIGRFPPLDRLFTNPLFFKHALVLHVNLALGVWFYAFQGALFFTLPSRGAWRWPGRIGLLLGGAGFLLMIASAFLPEGAPVLANYVPVLDHPVYLAGMALFGLGLVVGYLDGRIVPGTESQRGFFPLPSESRPGLRAMALAFLLAVLTFEASWISTPKGLELVTLYELRVWGGGHVLQTANAMAMATVWLILLHSLLGRAVLPRRVTSWVFMAMLLPLLPAPLLALQGTTSGTSHLYFTRQMQFGIFPFVSVFIIAGIVGIRRAFKAGQLTRAVWKDPRMAGLLISVSLTLLGWTLGAMISGSNTVIPAHYHASIGAVTAAFMAMTYRMLPAYSSQRQPVVPIRWERWQPVIFGAGQMVFAIGFALAGVHGAARKSYGVEQAARTGMETFGLTVMGIGGMVAVAGGLIFLWIVVAALRRRPEHSTQFVDRRLAWKTPTNIPFKN